MKMAVCSKHVTEFDVFTFENRKTCFRLLCWGGEKLDGVHRSTSFRKKGTEQKQK